MVLLVRSAESAFHSCLLFVLFFCVCFRFMNRRASANCRYQPTCYEHAANCYTHAVSGLNSLLFFKCRLHNPKCHCFNAFCDFSPCAAPHCASLRGHGAAASSVRQRLGEDHCLGVRHGPVRPLPGLHCVSYHHLEEEPHEVRRSVMTDREEPRLTCTSTGCHRNHEYITYLHTYTVYIMHEAELIGYTHK